MADPIIRFLTPRTVRISTVKGVGTGFFIADQTILTCAHVVRFAAENKLPISISYAEIDPAGQETFIKGEVIHVKISDKYGDPEYPDIGLIRINTGKPNKILMLPIEVDEIRYATDLEYIAFGFQKQDPQSGNAIAQAVSLTYEYEEGDAQSRKIIFENGLVRGGMSGAPLIERQGMKVTGLVHMTRDQNSNLGALTIPIDKAWTFIHERDPELYQELRSPAFRKKAHREFRKDYPAFPLLEKYWKNIAVLMIVLFLAYWWFFTHIGEFNQSAVYAALLVIFPLVFKLAGDWLGAEVDEAGANVRNKIVSWLFDWRVLSLGLILVGALWIFVSSVWIVGSPENAELKLMMYDSPLMDSGRMKHLDDSHQASFLVPVFNADREIVLKPENREAVTITIQRGKRNTLHYPFDFKLEPVVFLRFSNDYVLFENFNSYLVQIISKESNLNERLDSLRPAGALLIGNRNIEITPALIAGWKQSSPDANAETQQDIVDTLSHYQHLSFIDFALGDSVQIRLIGKADDSLYFSKAIQLKNEFTEIQINL